MPQQYISSADDLQTKVQNLVDQLFTKLNIPLDAPIRRGIHPVTSVNDTYRALIDPNADNGLGISARPHDWLDDLRQRFAPKRQVLTASEQERLDDLRDVGGGDGTIRPVPVLDQRLSELNRDTHDILASLGMKDSRPLDLLGEMALGMVRSGIEDGPAAAVSGPIGAEAALLERLMPRIRTAANGLAGRFGRGAREMAEDVAQEGMLRAAQAQAAGVTEESRLMALAEDEMRRRFKSGVKDAARWKGFDESLVDNLEEEVSMTRGDLIGTQQARKLAPTPDASLGSAEQVYLEDLSRPVYRGVASKLSTNLPVAGRDSGNTGSILNARRTIEQLQEMNSIDRAIVEARQAGESNSVIAEKLGVLPNAIEKRLTSISQGGAVNDLQNSFRNTRRILKSRENWDRANAAVAELTGPDQAIAKLVLGVKAPGDIARNSKGAISLKTLNDVADVLLGKLMAGK